MKKIAVVVGFFLLSIGLIATSQAGLVLSTDGFTGSSKVYTDGTLVTSTPRDFSTKTIAGFTGLGVSGGAVEGELDRFPDWEVITITFPTPIKIDYISLAFLYPPGEFSDVVFESAIMSFDKSERTLTAVGPTSAIYGFAGSTVTNLSVAADGTPGPEGGAIWKIANPYADAGGNALPVRSIEFFANAWVPIADYSSDARNSDYSIVAVAPVPEPGTMMLLGSGLAGLAGWGRKKFHK